MFKRYDAARSSRRLVVRSGEGVNAPMTDQYFDEPAPPTLWFAESRRR